MAIQATWPSSSDEPYEVSVSTSSSVIREDVGSGNDEFDRFEALTRRLVSVTKGDLVELRED